MNAENKHVRDWKCEYPTKVFLTSVGIILVLTALAKYYSITGSARILDANDPIFGIKNREVMLLAALLESGLSAFIFLGRNCRMKLMWIAWLGGNFFAYHIGFWVVRPPHPCSCLGVLTQKLPVNPATLEMLLFSFVAYMLLGSVFFLTVGGGIYHRVIPEGSGGNA